jgi:hypothetical protein
MLDLPGEDLYPPPVLAVAPGFRVTAWIGVLARVLDARLGSGSAVSIRPHRPCSALVAVRARPHTIFDSEELR